jgi:hypothetical protein
MFHYTSEWSDRAVRRFAEKVGNDTLNDLIQLRLADRVGSGKRQELPRAISELMRHIEEVKAKEAELKVTDLAVGGSHLMNLGIKPGPEMGHILKSLLIMVKNEEIPNEESALLKKIQETIENRPPE